MSLSGDAASKVENLSCFHQPDRNRFYLEGAAIQDSAAVNSGWSERAALWCFVAVVAYAVTKSVMVAAWKLFGPDEICTVIVAGQPSVSAIWAALGRGADGNPPPYYLLERFFRELVSNEQIAYRLSSILAFGLTLLCVFVFVRRRSGGAVALFCASTLLVPVIFDVYATEARPYSIMVACVALGLVCYQKADSLKWVVLLASALMLAEAMHYYAVLAIVPFAMAESAFLLRSRRLRMGVWLALASPLAPLAAFWPFLQEIKARYGEHVWSRPTIQRAAETYGWLFHNWHGANAKFYLPPAAAFLAAGVTLAVPSLRARWTRDPFFHEHMLVLGLVALPFVGYAAARLAHGGLTSRYFLATVLSLPLAAGYVLQRLGRSAAWAFAILVLSCVGIHEARSWLVRGGGAGDRVAFDERMLAAADHGGLPIVISSGHDYLRMSHYATVEWAKRFVSVVDCPAAVAYAGSDSVDQQLEVLATISPMQVFEFSAFASDHREFLLYAGGDAEVVPFDWWPERLKREGWSLERIEGNGRRSVYLVRSGRLANQGS